MTTRRRPTKKQQVEILWKQRGKCYWCEQKFGQHLVIKRKNKWKVTVLKPQFDHVIPLSYLQENPLRNFVAVCQFCNRWKSSKMFNSEAACHTYLLKKWLVAIEKGVIDF